MNNIHGQIIGLLIVNELADNVDEATPISNGSLSSGIDGSASTIGEDFQSALLVEVASLLSNDSADDSKSNRGIVGVDGVVVVDVSVIVVIVVDDWGGRAGAVEIASLESLWLAPGSATVVARV